MGGTCHRDSFSFSLLFSSPRLFTCAPRITIFLVEISSYRIARGRQPASPRPFLKTRRRTAPLDYSTNPTTRVIGPLGRYIYEGRHKKVRYSKQAEVVHALLSPNSLITDLTYAETRSPVGYTQHSSRGNKRRGDYVIHGRGKHRKPYKSASLLSFECAL